MFRVVSQYDGEVWFESKIESDCEEYLNNCKDIASEKELAIEEIN